ncbi:MAG TPA: hypothetical protein VNZ26_03635 [Vicinamibacterales bacterium]|jgi:hypothetical protein|nr:hypothetical protein [Vicinamibacterales bacterium]
MRHAIVSVSTMAMVTCVGLAAAPGAQIRLTFTDGRVSLLAADATLPQILAEWARVGQTRIVADRVSSGPMTLELDNVSEEDALGVLLGSVSGYVAVQRQALSNRLSRFDRILVMPTSASPPPASAPALPPVVPSGAEHQRKPVRPPG